MGVGLDNPAPYLKTKAMKFEMTLTWSKLMALVVLAGAVALDWENGSVSTFQFALPFVVFLITGKQFLDYRKEKVAVENGDETK